jgi:hypothetical protein
MTIRKLAMQREEFEYLSWNFKAAAVFFKEY